MVIPPEQVGDVTDYDAMVLGSAVYTGHWLEPAKELVRRSGDAFAGRPVWLFSSGPVGDPTRALVQKMRADPVDLAEIRERTNAREHRMFEGRLEKDRLGLPQKLALSVFRGLEGDFRNWDEIRGWANEIAEQCNAVLARAPHAAIA